MTGFFVHRNSRLEVLADRLIGALARERPANPLAAQTIVVAHPGLGRWLRRRLADAQHIAANYRVLQPWQWLEHAAQIALGESPADAEAWRRQALRWRIHAALPTINDASLKASLAGNDAPRRRFQLADRLSALFTQYLLYRPDMLAAWEADPKAGDWQATLWRGLRKSISAPHRAQRQRELLDALRRDGDGIAEPLHVFGVSHLPPDTLDALQALSARRAVHLYFPDPCHEYWADLKSRRQLLRMGEVPQDWYFEIGHPLLVSLGRMAQDFLLALDDRDIDYSADAETVEPQESKTLLGAVQASVRTGKAEDAGAVPARRSDASLRVHACATRLRELEVLRDALLGLLADDQDLQPRDIVVMAPDIGAYAPYLPAVFGAPARYEHNPARIPWHLADVGLATAHPLLRAFARLLDLAESRFGLSEVLDLLDVPAIARRAGLRTQDRSGLQSRLRVAGVAWGLDAAAKEHAGGAAVAANSWAFGFDRLFAGLIAGEEIDSNLLDGILPQAGAGNEDAGALGRLHEFIASLRLFSNALAVPRTLTAWCDWLGRRVDDLFESDGDDAAESAAMNALRDVLADLREQDDAGTKLPWSVAREALRGALAMVPERQPFLLGGVTFCGLVPQRSIPFKVVCLVGMNEGEFPRPGGDEGLNLLLRDPRRGDRDTRREDRQLFLEALMAARTALHVSYVGADVETGKPRNPAAPLAELVQFLDEQHGLCGDVDKVPRPWRVEHALQAHAACYYDGKDPALFSFSGAYAEAKSAAARMPAFADWAAPRAGDVAAQRIDIDWLKRFWRDPAKVQLREDAGVSLSALEDDDTLDREPMQAKADGRERVESRLLFDALANAKAAIAPTAPDWLARAGRLAGGVVGTHAYAFAQARAQAMLDAAHKALGEHARREAQAVDFECAGVRVSGHVRDVLRCGDGQLRLFGARIGRDANFADLIPFYIDWACLRLHGMAVVDAVFLQSNKQATKVAAPEPLAAIRSQGNDQLRTGLAALVEMALAARTQPIAFPPRSAWEWCNAGAMERSEKAEKAWQGSDYHTGERDYAPGYAALLLRDADWLDESSPAGRSFAATCARIADILVPRDAKAGT
ncbi:MAG: exodeoxyribonuclease V subunit gamma [Proteobacteria bacterium]|nr:exodeoxyribonuclease V subunit gamma [Pseudomonadota bacterium]